MENENSEMTKISQCRQFYWNVNNSNSIQEIVQATDTLNTNEQWNIVTSIKVWVALQVKHLKQLSNSYQYNQETFYTWIRK